VYLTTICEESSAKSRPCSNGTMIGKEADGDGVRLHAQENTMVLTLAPSFCPHRGPALRWRFYPPHRTPIGALSCCFTASDLQSRPNRQGDVPSDLPPKPQLVLAGLPNCPAPKHSRFRSIANSQSSTHIPARVPLSGSQRELVAEVSSPLPREPAPSLSLPA
jgi:hypothetical protein